MAENNENRLEEIERVEVTPEGGENVGDPEEEAEEGAEGAGAEPEEKPEGESQVIVKKKPAAAADEGAEGGEDDDEGDEGGEDMGAEGAPQGGTEGRQPKPVPGETPRERALREELVKARKNARQAQGSELAIGNRGAAPAATTEKKELSPEQQAILAKYKPAEIQSLREVLPAIAAELGFVRVDQLSAQHYNERAESELDTFLEAHPEYLQENDPEGVLWGKFKGEFAQYKPPANPKDYRKLFNRIHTEIFGIKPAGDHGTITAAQRKITVASHAGASGPTRTTPIRTRTAPSGLRLDMLKGFSEDEKKGMIDRAEG